MYHEGGARKDREQVFHVPKKTASPNQLSVPFPLTYFLAGPVKRLSLARIRTQVVLAESEATLGGQTLALLTTYFDYKSY